MKKSPWMPITTNPAHVGWYQLTGWFGESAIYVYWDGCKWGFWLDEARQFWICYPIEPSDKWRGKL